MLIITRDEVVSQRLKSFCFLGSQKLPCFLIVPYPVPVPKNRVIFIGCSFKSRASQVGSRSHKQKKDTASAKKGKVRLQRRGGRRLKAVL